MKIIRNSILITVAIGLLLAPILPSFSADQPAREEQAWIDLSGKRTALPDTSSSRLNRSKLLHSSVSSVGLKVELPGFYRSRRPMADGRTYSLIRAPGTGFTSPGQPDLPVPAELIVIPNGTRPILKVKPGKPRIFNDIEIAPRQKPLPDGEDHKPPFIKDRSIYRTDSDFPTGFAELEPVKKIRGREVSQLRIYPYRYNPVRKILKVYPDLEVTVTFRGKRTSLPGRLRSRGFDSLLRRAAINGSDLIESDDKKEKSGTADGESFVFARTDSGSSAGCDYLIVTHPDFSIAAETLAAWKRKAGFRTYVAETSETGSTAAEIKTYLQNVYDTWDPVPEYLLLLGDVEFVPTDYQTAHPNSGSLIGTDLYYTTLDGSDYFPDLSAGRISVDTAAEAENRVAAIITYESDPPADSSFYETAVICAYFQHYGSGYAERRFAQTAEDLALYLSDSSYLGEYTAERIYYTPSSVTPAYWSPWYFGGGPAGDPWDPIPTHLEKPGFAWDGAAAGISAAVNAGCFLLTHRDHGSATAWGDPSYSTGHAGALTNGELLPVVWSINCKTGWFDKETSATPSSTISFSETWERNSSGGAAGVIAASRVSYSGHNDRLFWGWIDAIWPGFISTYSGSDPAYRMGDVLNYGKIYYSTCYSDDIYRQTEFEIYHWFGDPAMMIRTENPESPDVTHPSAVGFNSATDLEVTVEIDGSPLEGATVTVSRSDVPDDYRTAVTDAAGTAVFEDLALSETGEYNLVVTAANTIPYQGVILSEDRATPTPTPPLLAATPTATSTPRPTSSPSPTAPLPPTPTPSPDPLNPPPWPASSATEIGGGLPSGYEPSGIVWQERLELLYLVSDDGWVSRMDAGGTVETTWTPGGDLEGIAVADPDSDLLYLGVENPDGIREFDLSAGTMTGKSWDLTPWMSGPDGEGLEALTFIPNGDHPYSDSSSGGVFYAGLQADGKIYVFDLDLDISGTVSHLDTIEVYPGLTDSSGLHYHAETGVLYAIFDGWDLILELAPDGTIETVYDLVGDTQEGVTLAPSCPDPETAIFIAEDAGEVWRYDDYPVTCLTTPTPSPTSSPSPPFTPWHSATPSPSPSPSSTSPPPVSPAPTTTPEGYHTPTPVPAATPRHLVIDFDDYDGDGYTDYALYRPSTGQWFIDGITEGVVWGGSEGDIPAPGDYDGDGTADIAYFNRFSGRWYVLEGIGSEVITSGLQWGRWGDWPVPGDYNGDGTTDYAVWDFDSHGVGRWQVLGQDPDPWGVDWGHGGDIPVPGDYDGDGSADFAVWRPSTGKWYIRPADGSSPYALQWGWSATVPIPGDFDGDGDTDPAVYWPRATSTTWFMVRNMGKYNWGWVSNKEDRAAIGNFQSPPLDAEIAIYRAWNQPEGQGAWYIYGGSPIEITVTGESGDLPAVGQAY